MPPPPDLSNEQARWLAIEAQGLHRDRPSATITRRHIHDVFARVGTIQLDAVNVVERTQFLVLFSRLGAYDVKRLHDLCGPGGEIFEYWGHAASLLPMTHQPLMRWRMEHAGPYGESDAYATRREEWRAANQDYLAAVLAEVRDRGPLAASQLTDPRRQQGEWWGRRSIGRQALEWLFFKGDVTGWRAPNFERIYDLPERVIPADVLAQPTPPIDEAQRRLLILAAGSLGVGTARELADYYRLNIRTARDRLAELVEAGEIELVTVEGWREPGFVLPTARPTRPRRRHATLLSPFDSLIWERTRTRRLFGFDYRIEIYVPEAQRTHGYYVLPLLVGDALVARFDLKADRATSTLRVRGSHLEPDADQEVVATEGAHELDALRDWLGLDTVAVDGRAPLANALRRALR